MINIGIGISWVKALYSVAANIVANFRARVAADNGIFEAAPYLDVTLDELNAIGLLDKASLITTPNAYKESKLYSVVPSDGAGDMTVVRATTATRVNSDGLIEQVPYNLLTYSEQFDNASWSKSLCTVDSNVVIAPNGTLTGDKITRTSSGSSVQQSVSSFGSTSCTFSVFVKTDLVDNGVRLLLYNITSSAVVGSVTYNTIAEIDNDYNGWKRVVLTITNFTSGNNIRAYIYSDKSSGSIIDSSLLIWGAQLEQGTLTDYFPTTDRLNVPRIDYTSGEGAILVEPQRTNSVLRSEDTDNVIWIKEFISSSNNNTLSPRDRKSVV